MKHRLVVFTLVVCFGFVSAAQAQNPKLPCEVDGVERVVAVGDVHGAYDNLLKILQAAGLIDARQRWTGGKAHLVQLGDMLDRGPDSRKVLDFYRKLDREASSAGGRLHVLLGNHEAMRMTGDRRYVSPGEYKAFSSGGSQVLLSNFVDAVADPATKTVVKAWPLGALEMIQAFGSKSPYGAFLLSLNAVVRINGVVFSHAGISPATAAMTCSAINEQVRRELTTDLEKTQAAPATTLAMGPNGPLWYRGLAMDPEATLAPQVDEILKAQQARALVIAHTPRETGLISSRFDGKVILIDTGMQSEYVPTGKPSALELTSGAFTAIYLDGRQPVVAAEVTATAPAAAP